jgi:hypothetical protein
MARKSGGGREFDPEYKHFRECIQGYWGENGREENMANKPETPENKKLLGILMNRKHIINAGGDKPLTPIKEKRRHLQGQILLDIAWAEIHGHRPWHELDKDQRKKYQYRDEHGNVRYHRPNDVYEAAGYEPEYVGTPEAIGAPVWVSQRKKGTYVTHFMGKKLSKPRRVKIWATANKERINKDPDIAFAITKQKPYEYTTKKGKHVVVKDPHKWRVYDKKTGKTIRWIGE